MKQENFNWREDPNPEHRCLTMAWQWLPQITADTVTEDEPERRDGGDFEMGPMQSQSQGDEERTSLLDPVEVV